MQLQLQTQGTGSFSPVRTPPPPPPAPAPHVEPLLWKLSNGAERQALASSPSHTQPAHSPGSSGPSGLLAQMAKSLPATVPPLPDCDCDAPTLPPSNAKPGDAPLPIKAEGKTDYYLQRAADFEARNPGMKAPDYYTDYGTKYAERFSKLDSTDLSPAGLAWRDKTLVNLQEAMEAKRAEDPAAFEAIEKDPEAFRQMAYEMHVKAYLDAGLADLPVQDLLVIAATPDFPDVVSGIPQMAKVVAELVKPENVIDIAKATVEQTVKDAWPLPPIILMPGPGPLPMPVLNPSVVGKEVERVVDRLADHCEDLPLIGGLFK